MVDVNSIFYYRKSLKSNTNNHTVSMFMEAWYSRKNIKSTGIQTQFVSSWVCYLCKDGSDFPSIDFVINKINE